jgi:hypothetical protein
VSVKPVAIQCLQVGENSSQGCYGRLLASLKVALSNIQGKESHRYDNFSDATGSAHCGRRAGDKKLEGMLAAVFEDDGRTGYFYALDESLEGNPILDAVHIYNVEDISDAHIPSDVKIGWSEDCQKCVLPYHPDIRIPSISWGKMGTAEADTHPRSFKDWSVSGHEWSDSVDDFPVSAVGLTPAAFLYQK